MYAFVLLQVHVNVCKRLYGTWNVLSLWLTDILCDSFLLIHYHVCYLWIAISVTVYASLWKKQSIPSWSQKELCVTQSLVGDIGPNLSSGIGFCRAIVGGGCPYNYLLFWYFGQFVNSFDIWKHPKHNLYRLHQTKCSWFCFISFWWKNVTGSVS